MNAQMIYAGTSCIAEWLCWVHLTLKRMLLRSSCALCRFAHMIGTREHTQYLWRISKDQDQHSHVAQEPLMG